jgi:hypothetical protein
MLREAWAEYAHDCCDGVRDDPSVMRRLQFCWLHGAAAALDAAGAEKASGDVANEIEAMLDAIDAEEDVRCLSST